MPKSRILVFSKIPGLAACKTRLLQGLTLAPREGESLAKAFLIDTLRHTSGVDDAEICLCSEPEISPAQLEKILAESKFSSGLPFNSFSYMPQNGTSFAERLQNACSLSFEQEVEHLVLIGSDSPMLPAKTLRNALKAVARDEIAVGPSQGGGFYLLGISKKQHEKGFSAAEIFNYSSGSQVQRIAELARQISTPINLLETHFDIDLLEDLISLDAITKALSISKNSDSRYHSFPEATAWALQKLQPLPKSSC